MTRRFLMKATPQAEEFFNEISADMALSFSISSAEAVARINQHWHGQEFLDPHDMLFHEDAHYWAMVIYFAEVPDWSPDADRSRWVVRAKPDLNSECWTIGNS